MTVIVPKPPVKEPFVNAICGIDRGTVKHTDVCNGRLLAQSLKTLPKHWRNWVLRAIFGTVLITYFCYTIYKGPLYILITTLAIQVKCFSEIMDVGYKAIKIPKKGRFWVVPWYFLIVANYFFYGEAVSDYFGAYTQRARYIKMAVVYHRFISFCVYFMGLILFLLTLVRKYDVRQFSVLALTHLTILVIVAQSYMIVKSLFQGLIWLVVPVSLVSCNDIASYIFGLHFGRTPLTKLSPKKTWEGFIGGAISTISFGILLSYILCNFTYFTCPVEYVEVDDRVAMLTNCTPSNLFQYQSYNFSLKLSNFLEVDGYLSTYPYVFHSLALSSFSSIIAPFGGIFASGFKRAFNVKDFGNTIPGHGGILDRFDCQFMVATFVNVYLSSFIRTTTPERIIRKVFYMKAEDQLQFYHLFEELLKNKNLLNS